jgi:hypothetical protein
MALSKPVKDLGDWESGDFLTFLMEDDGTGKDSSLAMEEHRVNPTNRGAGPKIVETKESASNAETPTVT